ncbi:MAG: hypothetical protein QM763_13855 [Agriterribacter sp.]
MDKLYAYKIKGTLRTCPVWKKKNSTFFVKLSAPVKVKAEYGE